MRHFGLAMLCAAGLGACSPSLGGPGDAGLEWNETLTQCGFEYVGPTVWASEAVNQPVADFRRLETIGDDRHIRIYTAKPGGWLRRTGNTLEGQAEGLSYWSVQTGQGRMFMMRLPETYTVRVRTTDSGVACAAL